MGLIKSYLNYTGNKYKLLPEILPIIQSKNIRTFVDVFTGGANVVANVDADNKEAYDIDYQLINLHKFMQNYPGDLEKYFIDLTAKHSLDKENKEAFFVLRKLYNKTKSPDLLFLLACHSMSNTIRYNSKHDFNQSFGKRTLNKAILDRLNSFAKKLSNISFSHKDFRQIDYYKYNSDDFLYFDPPYLLSTALYSDGKRAYGGWTDKDFIDLTDILKILSDRGIRWALSECLFLKGKHNYMLDLFLDKENLNVHYLSKSYKNSFYSRNNKKDTEILVTNY